MMKRTNIWIIDDNEAVGDALKFLLNSIYNSNVTVYQNPLLFLEELSPEWEGYLISDLLMESMNGIELTKRLKKLKNNLKIIIMSGHGTPDSAEKSLAVGADAFLIKPFQVEDLLEKLQDIDRESLLPVSLY